MNNDALLIKTGAGLLAGLLLMIVFIFLPIWARMDAQFIERYGCTPAEMARDMQP